jgi:serine/threonine protein kinase
VAIKRIHLDHLRYDEQLENNREQNFMLQLHHTNILHLLHVEDDLEFRFYN